MSRGFTVRETATAPGLLAPSSFNIGGVPYLVATFQDGVTFVGAPNLIPGVPFRAAAPGDSITAYDSGFGPVTPASPPGIVAGAANSIANLTVAFGAATAKVTYAGLAPATVGLYQFNIVVPGVPDGNYPITFQAGAIMVPQTAYLTVHR